jgi:lysophospholipase L1-like esterase
MTDAAKIAVVKQRTHHRIGAQTGYSGLVLTWANIDASYGANTNPVTFRAALEYPVGTSHPLHFHGGERDATLEPGATISSVPLPIDVPAGAAIAVEIIAILPRDGVIWSSNLFWGADDAQTVYTRAEIDAGSLPAMTTGGALGPPSTTNILFPPISIRGLPRSRCSLGPDGVPRPTVAVALYGDSILVGRNDTPADGTYGFMERALGNAFAWLTMAQTSMRISSLTAAGTTGRRFRFAALDGITHVICNLGTNDIYNHRTVQDIKADYATLATQLDRHGIRLIQITLTPRTNSTNTALLDAARSASIQRLNAWIMTNPFGGGAIDVAEAARDPDKPDFWRSDLRPYPRRFDGTHPPDFIHAAMAELIAARLPAKLTSVQQDGPAGSLRPGHWEPLVQPCLSAGAAEI